MVPGPITRVDRRPISDDIIEVTHPNGLSQSIAVGDWFKQHTVDFLNALYLREISFSTARSRLATKRAATKFNLNCTANKLQRRYF